MKQKLILLLLIGLILRLIFSVANYNSDVSNHIAWGKDIVINGLSGFYEREFMARYGQAAPNYPPLAMISFAFMTFLYNLISPLIWKLNLMIPFFPSKLVWFWKEQKFMLPAFIKVPAIIADLGIAYFIYLFAKKLIKSKKSSLPLWATSLVLFNPAFFYNSSYWGQTEALPLVFLLAAFYLMLYSEQYLLSAILMISSLLSKQIVIVFVPLYFLVFLSKFGPIKTVKGLLVSVIFFILIFLPFNKNANFIIYPFITFWNKIQTNFGENYLAAHTFNFWGLTTGLGRISDSTFLFFGVSVRWWSLGFVGLITIIILYFVYKRKFTTFLFLTRMHERHLEMILPFLLLAGINNKAVLKIFIFISFFHFVNLYSGWCSPHIEFLIKFFSSSFVINLLIITVIVIYCYLIFQYFFNRILHSHGKIYQ